MSSGNLRDALLGLGNMFKQVMWWMSLSHIHRLDLGVFHCAKKSGTLARFQNYNLNPINMYKKVLVTVFSMLHINIFIFISFPNLAHDE